MAALDFRFAKIGELDCLRQLDSRFAEIGELDSFAIRE